MHRPCSESCGVCCFACSLKKISRKDRKGGSGRKAKDSLCLCIHCPVRYKSLMRQIYFVHTHLILVPYWVGTVLILQIYLSYIFAILCRYCRHTLLILFPYGNDTETIRRPYGNDLFLWVYDTAKL